MARYLVVMEVSQKQAYIFESNHLRDNRYNSTEIAYITSNDYFEKALGPEVYSSNNIVYAGGGHTVLDFESKEKALEFSKKISRQIMVECPRMELFIAMSEYDDNNTPGGNLKELMKKLEEKKSRRRAYFHQENFGIEEMNADTYKMDVDVTSVPKVTSVIGSEAGGTDLEKLDREIDINTILPKSYDFNQTFETLGGSEGESNFVAIVHIDGNGMGKRVQEFYEKNNGNDWESFKKSIREFSEAIDKDFKSAFRDMNDKVDELLSEEKLDELKLKDNAFPVIRIISSGDDICFATDGRIGIECAATFISALKNKINVKDGKGYSACAGVAIVHKKYPFYRAYELAEALCSNAKKFGASLSKEDNGASVSSIDWHIEFGELADDLEQVREQFITKDNKHLELRPYIVDASNEVLDKEKIRNYATFKKLFKKLSKKYNESGDNYSRIHLKQLRTVLKSGEAAAWHYLEFHKLDKLAMESYQGIYTQIDYDEMFKGEELEKKLFIKTLDEKERSCLFDAIELLDDYIPFD